MSAWGDDVGPPLPPSGRRRHVFPAGVAGIS